MWLQVQTMLPSETDPVAKTRFRVEGLAGTTNKLAASDMSARRFAA